MPPYLADDDDDDDVHGPIDIGAASDAGTAIVNSDDDSASDWEHLHADFNDDSDISSVVSSRPSEPDDFGNADSDSSGTSDSDEENTVQDLNGDIEYRLQFAYWKTAHTKVTLPSPSRSLLWRRDFIPHVYHTTCCSEGFHV